MSIPHFNCFLRLCFCWNFLSSNPGAVPSRLNREASEHHQKLSSSPSKFSTPLFSLYEPPFPSTPSLPNPPLSQYSISFPCLRYPANAESLFLVTQRLEVHPAGTQYSSLGEKVVLTCELLSSEPRELHNLNPVLRWRREEVTTGEQQLITNTEGR